MRWLQLSVDGIYRSVSKRNKFVHLSASFEEAKPGKDSAYLRQERKARDETEYLIKLCPNLSTNSLPRVTLTEHEERTGLYDWDIVSTIRVLSIKFQE